MYIVPVEDQHQSYFVYKIDRMIPNLYILSLHLSYNFNDILVHTLRQIAMDMKLPRRSKLTRDELREEVQKRIIFTPRE
jgi:hypothetical protein